ncbi:hypothetical protein MTO96_043970, partial [Rhipicephalus appendiculatus]
SQAFKRNARSRTPPSPKGRARTSRPAVSVGAHASSGRTRGSGGASFDGGSGRSLRGLEALEKRRPGLPRGALLSVVRRHTRRFGGPAVRGGHRCNRMARQSPEFASAFRCNRASWTPSRSLCDLW